MKKILVLLFLLPLSVFGADYLIIPDIPDFIPAKGDKHIVIHKGIIKDIVKNEAEEHGSRGVDILLDDESYVFVDHAWMMKFIKWWDNFKASAFLYPRTNAFDCENFCELFVALAHTSLINHDSPQAAAVVGTLYVRQEFRFGAIGDGGGFHAVVFFFSEKGLFVVEPQGSRSWISSLDKYPNKALVYKVLL